MAPQRRRHWADIVVFEQNPGSAADVDAEAVRNIAAEAAAVEAVFDIAAVGVEFDTCAAAAGAVGVAVVGVTIAVAEACADFASSVAVYHLSAVFHILHQRQRYQLSRFLGAFANPHHRY